MQLFEVVFEMDGNTVKAPGVVETEVQRYKYYYAASSAERVWEAIATMRDDPERVFISIGQALPMVTVLSDPTPSEPQSGDQRE